MFAIMYVFDVKKEGDVLYKLYLFYIILTKRTKEEKKLDILPGKRKVSKW